MICQIYPQQIPELKQWKDEVVESPRKHCVIFYVCVAEEKEFCLILTDEVYANLLSSKSYSVLSSVMNLLGDLWLYIRKTLCLALVMAT